jgi:MoxR-like ATPase
MPEVTEQLSQEIVAFVHAIRHEELFKSPGIAESIDWALSLAALGREKIDETSVEATLGTVLKYREDQQRVIEKGIPEMVRNAVLRGGG